MKISVLINNFNYRLYLEECIESVLNQTRIPDEIIFVDDGSVDASVDMVRKCFGNNKRLKIVEKENGGQLSAFNSGIKVTTGDIILFLDSDDAFEPNYVEKIEEFYTENQECQFTYCAFKKFGDIDKVVQVYEENTDMGFSVINTLFKNKSVGGPTSTLSVKKSLLCKFMPLPFEEQYRICADDCIVFAASIVGGRKFYLSTPYVRYRIHENNNFYGKKIDYNKKSSQDLSRIRLFKHLVDTFKYDIDLLLNWVEKEFKFIDRSRSFKEFFRYLKIIIFAEKSIFWKLEKTYKVNLSFVRMLRAGI